VVPDLNPPIGAGSLRSCNRFYLLGDNRPDGGIGCICRNFGHRFFRKRSRLGHRLDTDVQRPV